MKHVALCMAVLGLAFTGCAQNQVFGPLARKGSENLKMAFSKSSPEKNVRGDLDAMGQSDGDIQLAAFGGGCNDTCCGDDCCCECPSDCCGGEGCCGQCCGDGCCSSSCCSDGSCGSGSCKSGNCKSGKCKSGGGFGDRCRRMCGLNPHAGGYPEPQNFNPSPPSGQVAYPYYTTRGPRDFLQKNPSSIGPY